MNGIKRILKLCFLCLNICFNGLSQTNYQYQYSYDPTGNRIQRIMLPNRIASAGNDSLPIAKSVINGKQVSIYPNPTNGTVTVQIKAEGPITEAKAEVYDLQGRMVFAKEKLTEFTSIDITTQPAGNYLLRIWVEGKRREWMVVKPAGR